MNRSRLLAAVPAATAMVLAGGSPAWAGGDGHHDHDTRAEVIDIKDEAELEDDGEVLEVTFEYKCEEEDENSVTADVVAENKDEDEKIRYEADDEDLDCNGERNEITVELKVTEDYAKAQEGDWVKVTVTISENGDELDEESEWVEVVDEKNNDNGDERDHGKHGH